MTLTLTSVEIRKLFYEFDHFIPLNHPDGVSIVFGPNGIGKTVILQLINNVHCERFEAVANIPFTEFSLCYSDGSSLSITRKNGGDTVEPLPSPVRLVFMWQEEGNTLTYEAQYGAHVTAGEYWISAVEQYLPFLAYMGARTWRNIETAEILSIDEIVDRYETYFPPDLRMVMGPPEWLKQKLARVRIRFIETQRLLNYRKRRNARDRSDVVPAVKDIAEDLAGRIQRKLAEYATFSQQLDRSYPERLVRHLQDLGTSYDSQTAPSLLDAALRQNEDRRKALLENGMIDPGEESFFTVPPTLQKEAGFLLSLYIQDVSRKLDFFDEFSAKVQLLRRIVRSKFLFKELQVNKEAGMRFVSTAGKPHEISINALSSGEQHEVILLYDLLFRVEPNTLVLLDEPEISLHIDWQQEFLRDLVAIARLSSIQVLIATHSPHLIYDRWDLAVQLDPNRERSETVNAKKA